MPSRQKESLYADRIFGDGETPPRPARGQAAASLHDINSWFITEEDEPATVNKQSNGTANIPHDNSVQASHTVQLNDNTIYPFSHDILASARLNLQHHLFTSTNTFLLHPLIPLSPSTLIADIGCGTGIWSLQLSSTLPPGSRIEAFDLSLAQTPPPQWTPSNVSFQQLDIFETLPEHMLGKYDIINIRLFICVISSGNPIPLLKQLLRLLKPGGYLQWQEYDSTTDRIVLADPSTSAPKLEALLQHVRSPALTKEIWSWPQNLHTRFEEAGGKLVRHERHRTRQEDIMLKQETGFMSVREWAAKLKGKDPEEARKLERMVEEAERECWELGRGSFIDGEMVTWIVRKE